MAKIPPPTSFDFNKPETWLEWKKRVARYRSVSKLNEERQVDTLIYVNGHEAGNAFGQLSLTEEERKDFDKVGQAFDCYFHPKTNIIL